MTRALKAAVLLQKMFQCPYFFFDVVYIHNGADEKEEEMSWKVRGRCACGWQVGVDGVSQNPPALGLGNPTSILQPWSPGPAGCGHLVIPQPFLPGCRELAGAVAMVAP